MEHAGVEVIGTTAGVSGKTAQFREPRLPGATPDIDRVRDQIEGVVRRLAPADRARFLLDLDASIRELLDEAAVAANGGVHPRHALTRFFEFVSSRVRADEHVLDLGCGDGQLASIIAERSHARVTGLDWNEKDLGKARIQAQIRGLTPAPRYIGDDFTTCRAEGEFDVLVLSGVLDSLHDRARLLRLWMDWYAPSRVIVRVAAADRDWSVAYAHQLGTTPNHEAASTGFTRGQIERELGEAGLAVTELHSRWGEYWIVAEPTPVSGELIRVPAGVRTRELPQLSRDEYVALQIKASRSLRDPGAPTRIHSIIASIAEIMPPRAGTRVLCLGCANGVELDLLAAAGYSDSVGIDLVACDPRVLTMDMHDLSFASNSFDVVLACRAFEHALEPRRVASEIGRVLRPDGLAAIETCNAASISEGVLWEFESPERLAGLFRGMRVVRSELRREVRGPVGTSLRILCSRVSAT